MNWYAKKSTDFRLAAILCRKYRVPSEPRSQAASGEVSTGVGDHFGTPRAAGFFLLHYLFYPDSPIYFTLSILPYLITPCLGINLQITLSILPYLFYPIYFTLSNYPMSRHKPSNYPI